MAPIAVFLRNWSVDAVPVTGLAVATVAYLAAVRRVNRRNPTMPWPHRCTARFLAAVAVALAVVIGPIGSYDDTFFWAHMVQHLALMMVVAPLLLLGAPVLLVLRASPPWLRRGLVVPVLRSRVVEVLTHPMVGWLIFAGVLLGTHFTGFFAAALAHPAVHVYVEHPLYLGAGLVYYYPLISGNPGPRRLSRQAACVSMLIMTVPEALTGVALYAPNHVLFGYYARVARPFGPGPLADQRLGAAIMLLTSLGMATACAVVAWRRNSVAIALKPDALLARG